MPNYITQLNGWYYYLRRVPTHLKGYDHRQAIRISLKTQDHKEALRAAAIHNDFIEQYWSDLVRNKADDPELERYRNAKVIARAHGFAYRNLAQVAEAPIEEIISRVEALGSRSPKAKREALLGAVKEPQIKLSQCLDKYWPEIEDRLVNKSEHQIRKYKVPRKAAWEHFFEVIGDQPIVTVSRQHVLEFRSQLLRKIADGAIVGNTANKQMSIVKDILITVGRSLQLEQDFEMLFSKSRVKAKDIPRPPFEAEYVQKTFMSDGGLSSLNEDARLIIYMMIETGARPAEIIGLTPEDFFLDKEVPHIWIRPNRIRSLKVDSTERKIPLVGISRQAAKAAAKTGILRYQKKPDYASGTINKYLREHNLLPSSKHSLYSIRHTFKDRLRDIGAPEEVIDELMGHKKKGPIYGRGHTLKTKYKWLHKIAFEQPDSLE